MSTDRSGQEGPSAEQIAASDRDAAQLPINSDAAADAAAQFLLDTAQQERGQQHSGHSLPPRPPAGEHKPFFADLPQAAPAGTGEALPLETAAAPGASAGGGASRYDSDFGRLIAGLRSGDGSGLPSGTATPDNSFATALVDDDEHATLVARAPNLGGVPAGPVADNGDDAGAHGDDLLGGNDDTALPGLFTVHADTADFNDVTAGSYRDGTKYDADNQNDVVILPNDAIKAAAAGFTPGTLFLAGNGDDTVAGGGLADLIDGGNGQDLLFGDGGDDTLLGGAGMDSLFGGDGNDLLSTAGANGKDLLDGGAGDDTLIGGNRNDTLIGGLGNDVMTGGEGRDTFRLSLSANEGDDLILDFTAGKGGDILQLGDVVDVTGDGDIDIADLDAAGHSVSGTADAIVITFDSGASITLAGLDGSGIHSFADLVNDAKVNVDIT